MNFRGFISLRIDLRQLNGTAQDKHQGWAVNEKKILSKLQMSKSEIMGGNRNVNVQDKHQRWAVTEQKKNLVKLRMLNSRGIFYKKMGGNGNVSLKKSIKDRL